MQFSWNLFGVLNNFEDYSCPETKHFRIVVLENSQMKLGRNLRILTCFWTENPFAFLLFFIPSFQRLLFYKQQSGETEETVSLKTSFRWWINQPRRLAYLWRCFLFCEMIVFFVWFDVVVNCGWKPIGGQEGRGFPEVSRRLKNRCSGNEDPPKKVGLERGGGVSWSW